MCVYVCVVFLIACVTISKPMYIRGDWMVMMVVVVAGWGRRGEAERSEDGEGSSQTCVVILSYTLMSCF